MSLVLPVVKPEPIADLFGFFVPGIPVPQGSKKAFVVKGHAVIVDQQGKKLKEWRHCIADMARFSLPNDYWSDDREMEYELELYFVMKRPKGQRNPFKRPTVTPDLDKLVRAVLDALTEIVYPDDSQVVAIRAFKTYTNAVHPTTGLEVHVHRNAPVTQTKFRDVEAPAVDDKG